jgi:hypothetical protein
VAHQWALKLAVSQRRRAIDLARFDHDCPESEALISEFNPAANGVSTRPVAVAPAIELEEDDRFEPIPASVSFDGDLPMPTSGSTPDLPASGEQSPKKGDDLLIFE